MKAAADDLDAEVDHGVAGDHAAERRLGHSRLDGIGMVRGDRRGRRAVLVDETAAAGRRLDGELDVAVLAAGAELADELALALGAAGHGLAIRDLRLADPGVDAELAA